VRAVVFERFGEMPAVVDMPEPEPQRHGAVVRVEATGLCRSDWHAWRGHDPTVSTPHVPGHELVGTVTAIGRDVPWRWVGRRVTVPFVCSCGRCPECRSGNGQICRHQTQPGFTQFGSFADYVALDHADVNLIDVPDDLEAGAAAVLGCRFATAYRGVAHQARLQPDEWLLVVGSGGVGLSAVMIGHAIGARVIAVDVDDDALALARSVGARHTVRADRPDAAEEIRSLSDGGAHVSVDALGRESAVNLALHSLRRRGRHIQIGLFATDPRLAMAPIIAGELSVRGSHGMAASDYPGLLELVVHRVLKPQRLISRRLPLEQAPEALAAMDDEPVPGMTLIDVNPMVRIA
jgi:D-arabinose 1-dehydrogenase-like Zn-dependent alcohol dehydrogenase